MVGYRAIVMLQRLKPAGQNMWEFCATFAGPIATIIASAAAIIVTWRFGSIQAEIARGQAATAAAQKEIAQSQRDIAYDKLKHDLFDQRHEIYVAAKFIIERVVRTGTERPVGDLELQERRIKLDEARFFFPSKEVRLFESIDEWVIVHEVARAEWERYNEDDEIRHRKGDEMARAIDGLMAIYIKLPELLKDELGFAQLTSSGH